MGVGSGIGDVFGIGRSARWARICDAGIWRGREVFFGISGGIGLVGVDAGCGVFGGGRCVGGFAVVGGMASKAINGRGDGDYGEQWQNDCKRVVVGVVAGRFFAGQESEKL